ncbi:MAG: D-sedoheptulose 7-phosphate isomerase [Elusimicrobiota bacterium]
MRLTVKEKKKVVLTSLSSSIDVFKHTQDNCVDDIVRIAGLISCCLKNKRKVMFFGNGGSACDSQHLSAELVGRFQRTRRGLPALALNCNTAVLTALVNDLGIKQMFARQVEALAEKGDVVIGLSTSGNSVNVIHGLKQARKQGAVTVGFTGKSGGKIGSMVDVCLKIPSDVTARIQEGHIAAGHIICQLVEDELVEK